MRFRISKNLIIPLALGGISLIVCAVLLSILTDSALLWLSLVIAITCLAVCIWWMAAVLLEKGDTAGKEPPAKISRERLGPWEKLMTATNLSEDEHRSIVEAIGTTANKSCQILILARKDGLDFSKEDYQEGIKFISRLIEGLDSSFICITQQFDGNLVEISIWDQEHKSDEHSVRLRETADELMKRWNQENGDSYCLSLGTVEELSFLHYSYSRAGGILDHLRKSEDLFILSGVDIDVDQNVTRRRILQSDTLFYSYLISRQPKKAVEVMLEIFDIECGELVLPLDALHHRNCEMLSAMMRVLGYSQSNHFNLTDKFWRESVMRINHSESVQELATALCSIKDEFENNYQEQKTDYSKPLENYLDYIRQNYKNPSLNAQMVCDHFDVQPSYLSRLFKSETGLGVLAAIHNLRIEDAKKLLMTNQSIDGIAIDCGYYTRRGLDTAFKRYIGISPSDFRNSVSGCFQKE